MFNKKIISIISLVIVQQLLCVSHFILNIEREDSMCLDEYFSDKTLVIYSITSNMDKTNVKIYDPEEELLHDKVHA